MAETFQSQQELYRRVRPALASKVSEMKRLGYTYIKEEDIWNYLKTTRWNHEVGLSLSKLVDDILNTDNDQIQSYVLETLKHYKREMIS